MSRHRRWYQPGGTSFFTLVIYRLGHGEDAFAPATRRVLSDDVGIT